MSLTCREPGMDLRVRPIFQARQLFNYCSDRAGTSDTGLLIVGHTVRTSRGVGEELQQARGIARRVRPLPEGHSLEDTEESVPDRTRKTAWSIRQIGLRCQVNGVYPGGRIPSRFEQTTGRNRGGIELLLGYHNYRAWARGFPQQR